jgi:hypothetical protein
VTLVSEEGEELVIPRSLAQMSSLVSTMLGDDGSEEKKIPLQQIKGPVLVKVVEFMKRHVVNKLPEIEKPLKSADLSALQPPLDQWDIDFVTCDQVRGGRPLSPRIPAPPPPSVPLTITRPLPTVFPFPRPPPPPLFSPSPAPPPPAPLQEMLFELILAANYMDIKPLLDLACAKVASLIKGKTPEEIRKTFNIKNVRAFRAARSRRAVPAAAAPSSSAHFWGPRAIARRAFPAAAAPPQQRSPSPVCLRPFHRPFPCRTSPRRRSTPSRRRTSGATTIPTTRRLRLAAGAWGV